MKSKNKRIIGLISTTLSIITGGFLIYLLFAIKLFPVWLVVISVAIIVLLIIIAKLQIGFRKINKNKRYVIGIILSCIISIVFVLVSYGLYQPYAMLKNITDDQNQKTIYGIYVAESSDITKAKDFNDCNLGYINNKNEENRIKVLEKLIKSDIKGKLTVSDYSNTTTAIKSMEDKKSDAIAINAGLVNALSGNAEETEINADSIVGKKYSIPGASSKIRCIATYEVSEKISIKNLRRNAPFAVLISGSDSRGGLDATARNDVNILAIVNPKTRMLLLVNTPRDYYVPLSISNGVPDKLTHAGIYGEQVSMDTISMIYDTDVDYFFRINFIGFKKVIDTLGGITVHSDYNFNAGGYSFIQGDNEMDGDKALVFARERYSLAAGDLQRGKNQMYVIQAIVNKMIGSPDLKKYSSLWTELEDCFSTSVPYNTVSSILSSQIKKNSKKWNVQMYEVTGAGASKPTYSIPGANASVIIPDEKSISEAKGYINDVLAGKTVEIK